MLRKIVFAAATTFGLALPLGLNSSAQAYPPTVIYSYPPPPPVVYSYPVAPVVYSYPAPPVVVYAAPVYTVTYYGGHHRWYGYGTYASRWDADHAAHHLRHEGYTVRIEIR